MCFFVRLAGCNLACSYCDTPYAREETAGRSETIETIVRRAEASKARHACITGGEPFLQEATPMLAKALLRRGFCVTIETNGSLPLRGLTSNIRVVMDVKCPSSGMEEHNLEANAALLREEDEVKFVIGDRADFEWALSYVERHGIRERRCDILFSPVWDGMEPSTLAEWLKKEAPWGILNLQLHKYVWGPDARGV